MGIGCGLGELYIYLKNHPGADFSHHEPTLVTGTGDAPGLRGFSVQAVPSGPGYGKLLDQWRDLWATTVGLHYSPELTREALAAAVKAAHARQLAVVLLPPAHFATGNPYPRPLAEIAADAQAARVDRLCISWLREKPDPAAWRKEADAVRSFYKGKIIFAATPETLPEITCWDAGDYVGVIGPIRLPRRLPHASDDISMNDFRIYWACKLTEFESIGRLHELPVALLDMEVPPSVSFKLPLPGHAEAGRPPTPRLQAQSYEALLTETKGRSAFTDILLLTWNEPGSLSHASGLFPTVAAAWDPKKPKARELAFPEGPEDAPALEPVDLPGAADALVAPSTAPGTAPFAQ
jgi:hypothetical protein